MAHSLEDILSEQSMKLHQLTMATTLIQTRNNVTDELLTLHDQISALRNALDSTRLDLEIMADRNNSMMDLSTLLEKLNQKISHMENNMPPKLLHDYANVLQEHKESPGLTSQTPSTCTSKSASSYNETGEDKENTVENCKKILFNEPEIYPRLKLLHQDEFELIPKYMIGRQSLEALNQFLSTINEILKAKYSLLALGRNGAKKKGEFDLYMNYMKQESTNSKDKGRLYFFTAEDYNRHTKTKLDKTKLNLLTVLRHCKRLREVRADRAIQYTVVTP